MTEPSPEQIKAAIAGVFDRAAATYDQVGVDFFQPAARFLVGRTDPQPGESVLDVGCGRGSTAIPAAEAVGAAGSVLATDLAPAMVAAVRDAGRDLPWLGAEVGDAEQPPEGPFDVIQAGLVLFFLPSLDEALARYRAALARPGRLGFTWFGAPDARWDPVFEALSVDLPDADRPGVRAGSGPFTSVAAMHEHLVDQGWSAPATETLLVDVHVRDVDHWFEWTWSQGYRYVLEMLRDRGLLDAARERVSGLVEGLVVDDALTWRAEVHATLVHA